MLQSNEREHFLHLCECAAHEREPALLLALVKQINDLLAKNRSQEGCLSPPDGGPRLCDSPTARPLLGPSDSSRLEASGSLAGSHSR